jgi:UDP-N-acetylglucosamine 4,6-dehydratase
LAERQRPGSVSSLNGNDVTAIAGKSVLVTGASGSIGMALIRRLSREAPSEIRALQRTTTGVDLLRGAVMPAVPLVVITADVADCDAVASAMDGVDLVFHLAALKGVVACEERPALAVRANVIGSVAVVQAATRPDSHAVVVAASTDKACLSGTVLGLTKVLMERTICAAGIGSSVRLGGVLDSAGSVIDRWLQSARERGVIEVTDPEMTRFVMTKNDAVSALMRASERGRSGEILIPTMRGYRLGDLATVFARVHGVEIQVVGPRRGEERHAEALSEREAESAGQDVDWRVVIPGRQLGGVSAYRSRDAQRMSTADLEQAVGGLVST